MAISDLEHKFTCKIHEVHAAIAKVEAKISARIHFGDELKKKVASIEAKFAEHATLAWVDKQIEVKRTWNIAIESSDTDEQTKRSYLFKSKICASIQLATKLLR